MDSFLSLHMTCQYLWIKNLFEKQTIQWGCQDLEFSKQIYYFSFHLPDESGKPPPDENPGSDADGVPVPDEIDTGSSSESLIGDWTTSEKRAWMVSWYGILCLVLSQFRVFDFAFRQRGLIITQK